MYTQTGAAVDGATSDGSPSPPTHPYPTGRPHSASDPHIPFAYNVDESATPTPVTSPNPDAATPKSSYPDDVDPVRREELIKLLDRWEFEPHKLADADVLACASLLFEAAFEVEGMEEEAGVRFGKRSPRRFNLVTNVIRGSRSNPPIPTRCAQNIPYSKPIPQLSTCAGRLPSRLLVPLSSRSRSPCQDSGSGKET